MQTQHATTLRPKIRKNKKKRKRSDIADKESFRGTFKATVNVVE
jgi:hypothetical protein